MAVGWWLIEWRESTAKKLRVKDFALLESPERWKLEPIFAGLQASFCSTRDTLACDT